MVMLVFFGIFEGAGCPRSFSVQALWRCGRTISSVVLLLVVVVLVLVVGAAVVVGLLGVFGVDAGVLWYCWGCWVPSLLLGASPVALRANHTLPSAFPSTDRFQFIFRNACT